MGRSNKEDAVIKPEEVSVFLVVGKNEAFAKYFVGQSYLSMLTTDSGRRKTLAWAAPDSWFAHLAVEVPGEETATEGCFGSWV